MGDLIREYYNVTTHFLYARNCYKEFSLIFYIFELLLALLYIEKFDVIRVSDGYRNCCAILVQNVRTVQLAKCFKYSPLLCIVSYLYDDLVYLDH